MYIEHHQDKKKKSSVGERDGTEALQRKINCLKKKNKSYRKKNKFCIKKINPIEKKIYQVGREINPIEGELTNEKGKHKRGRFIINMNVLQFYQ